LFVENKFWAGLTDNQPISYLKQLAKYTQPTVLLVVVPEAREQTVWRELIRRLKGADISATDRYYVQDITQERFTLNPDSTIDVPDRPGLGVNIDRGALTNFTLRQINL